MLWTVSIILTCVFLAGYRVWTFCKRGLRITQGLGLAFDKRPLANTLVGITVSSAAMTFIFLMEYSAGWLQIIHVNSWTALVNDWITVIMVPLQEEFLFRCCLLGGLLSLFPKLPWFALLTSSLVFGGLHGLNDNASILSVSLTTLYGFICGIAFLQTERIWLSFGLHLGWNYCQAWIFGFSLSGYPAPPSFISQRDIGPACLTGGTYGPEGGYVGFGAVLFILFAVSVWLTIERRRGTPNSPREA